MFDGLKTILPVVGCVAVLHICLFIILRIQKNKKHSEPEPRPLLRGPGQSLLVRLDGVVGNIKACYKFLFTIPVAILVAHFVTSFLLKVPESWERIIVSVGIGLIYVIYYSYRLLTLSARGRVYRHAYQGELAVAKELNQLMNKGYHVYHDFPAEQFNIDHIVIGPTGVMAVETRTRSKAALRNRQTDAVVTYDGRMLHFPKYSDHKIIDQAMRQADWLSHWLSSAVGEEISARAIVTLPGWFVKRTSADGIPVVNPKQFETLFKHIKPRPISDGLMERIVGQIDQQCRNTGIDDNSCYSTLR